MGGSKSPTDSTFIAPNSDAKSSDIDHTGRDTRWTIQRVKLTLHQKSSDLRKEYLASEIAGGQWFIEILLPSVHQFRI
jgi:hypothetical protein